MPSKENIAKVKTMIDFLVTNNPYYAVQTNLDALFGDHTSHIDEGIPYNDAIAAVSAGYSGRDDIESEDGLVMENVGFTSGNSNPGAMDQMKLRVLNHCIGGGRFVQSRVGNQAVPDFENEALLSMLFPHLDPWGIGGFGHPGRKVRVSMEEQLRHLLSLWDSPFQRDTQFAFVYYNILQKRHISQAVRFRIVQQLLSIDPDRLQNLVRCFQADQFYQTVHEEDQRILRTLRQVSLVCHDVPGTAGHKVALRNQIRSLITYRGTPTFPVFICR
ncbi:hypothetical protein K474DRAFT_1683982 [Panus rudis PR-1116 ss-1]|nr:hypothetical protein K474DRAFT_1683982 [Panus rudis PR-1116 ss-1]